MSSLMALLRYSQWIGNVDPDPAGPRDFEVHYVRVYVREPAWLPLYP